MSVNAKKDDAFASLVSFGANSASPAKPKTLNEQRQQQPLQPPLFPGLNSQFQAPPPSSFSQNLPQSTSAIRGNSFSRTQSPNQLSAATSPAMHSAVPNSSKQTIDAFANLVQLSPAASRQQSQMSLNAMAASRSPQFGSNTTTSVPRSFTSPCHSVGGNTPLLPSQQFPVPLPQSTTPLNMNGDTWNFDALTTKTSPSTLNQAFPSNNNSSDPFDFGFSSLQQNLTTNISESPITQPEQNPHIDDPFGILTGKPTFTSKPLSNNLQPASTITPLSSSTPLSSNSSAISSPMPAHQSISVSQTSPNLYNTTINNNSTSTDESIARLLGMGFDFDAAGIALQQTNGNFDEAVNMLVSNRDALDNQDFRDSSRSQQRSQHHSHINDLPQSRLQSQNATSGISSGISAGGVVDLLSSNAKSMFALGKAKLAKVYEKASEKVAQAVDSATSPGTGGSVNSGRRGSYSNGVSTIGAGPGFGVDFSGASQYRDDSSDEDEIPLERPKNGRGKSLASKIPASTPARLLETPEPSSKSSTINSPSPGSQALNLFGTSNEPTTPPPPRSTSHQISNAAIHKETGNTLFKTGQFAAAESSYTLAIECIDPADTLLLVPFFNNRAAARLKTGDYAGAIEDCTCVLAIDRGDSKSLLRRAAAWEGREKWGEAAGDYETLMTLGVSNAVVLQGLKRARRGIEMMNGVGNGGGTDCEFVVTSVSSGAGGVASIKAADDLSFFVGGGGGSGNSVSGGVGDFSGPPSAGTKPMSKAAAKAVEKAVESLREQNRSLEREEEEKFQAKEAIEAQVESWKRGKEANIRALLSSLDLVLWPELQWKTINLSELITPQQVKVKYMKAVAKVHPDKLGPGITIQQKLIANEVFGALNKAWDAFKSTSG